MNLQFRSAIHKYEVYAQSEFMLRLDIRTITEEVRVYMALSLEKTDDLIEVSDCRNESRRYVKRDKGFDKHLAMVEETLARYGLVRNETRVYLHLARSGERKASEVAEAVSLNRTETYKILDDLEKKGLVYSAFEKPLKFTAVPLEKALDSLIDVQRNRTMLLEKEKSRLVDLWLSIPLLKAEDHEKQVFQILEGDEQMIRKANDLLEKAQDEIQIYAPSEYLAQLYHSDFGDSLKRRARRLRITLLTENSSKSLFFIRRMSWGTGKYRIVDLTNLPCFMIVDRKELLIAAQQNDQTKDAVCKKRSRTMALWTNYVAFVEILAMLFAKLGETGQAVHEIPMHFRVQQF